MGSKRGAICVLSSQKRPEVPSRALPPTSPTRRFAVAFANSVPKNRRGVMGGGFADGFFDVSTPAAALVVSTPASSLNHTRCRAHIIPPRR
jgi:hypothetical protein